jgi:hypothetical protein
MSEAVRLLMSHGNGDFAEVLTPNGWWRGRHELTPRATAMFRTMDSIVLALEIIQQIHLLRLV